MDLAETTNGAKMRQTVGVYTKTVVQSSVVHFVLHARIRHRRLNDVVFVGETFVHVKQVGREGHLQHIAYKDDFDARIRHAATFRHEHDPEDGDFLVKLEKDTSSFEAPAYPPQSIVLTLDSNDVVFMFLKADGLGRFIFVQQILPMPTFDRIMYQPGQHLAVDPYSRAVAVAAQEKEIIIYPAKPMEQTQHEIKEHVNDWCPVSGQRCLQVEGVILHLAFLIPADDDAEHIILLVIVVDQGLTKAILIDWHRSSGPIQAHVHPGQALETAAMVPSLLIPLQDTAFLLVIGRRLTLWKNILSGSMRKYVQPSIEDSSHHLANSGPLPVWASWAKPRRGQAARSARDDIYLVREDGLVNYILIHKPPSSLVRQNIAGSLDCHVGTAFASLGDEGDPDILCVAGDLSNGRVVSIGNWPSIRRIGEMSRLDTMTIQPIELLPNWASATDAVTPDIVHARRKWIKEADNTFITSGRQPFGAVTEMRQGIDGIALAIVTLEALQTTTDIWVLPELALGSLILVLTSPLETKILKLSADFDSPEDVGDSAAFDSGQRTLVAAITSNDILVQVTPKIICASSSIHENFEDTSKLYLEDDEFILSAAIVPISSSIVAAVRHGKNFAITCYSVSSADDWALQSDSCTAIPAEPLGIAAVAGESGTIVLTSTADGRLALLRCDSNNPVTICHVTSLPSTTDESVLCDHVALLQSEHVLLAICGLRDGTLVSYVVDLDDREQTLKHFKTITLGSSSVRLATMHSSEASAIAMTGSSSLLLTWNGKFRSLSIDNIWITDKAQPEFAPGPIVAVTQMPPANSLSSDAVAGNLLVISGEDLMVLQLGTLVSPVPRQIPTSGTPNRLVYAESLRHLVSSGLRYEVRRLPSKPQAPPTDKRQLWPVIDFIPLKGTHPVYTHHMQPGERINAILPWSFRRDGEKTYSSILVGGSYQGKNGLKKGKVTFLQPKIRSWEVVDVAETRQVKFDQEVTGLALYDDKTYVVCAGSRVHLYMLDVKEMKWEQRCPTFTLASAGIYVTVENANSELRQIVITTAADSVVILRVVDGPEDGTSRLQPVCTGPRADYLLSHLMLPYADDTAITPGPMILTGSKYGYLIGMSPPSADDMTSSEARNRSAVMHFEADLLRSLTRLRTAPPPARKGDRPAGLVSDRVLGFATDGAMVSIALLDPLAWRKLFWLQRLVEWSDVLSPFSRLSPAYKPGEDGMVGRSRAVPIGLAQHTKAAEIMLLTNNNQFNDMHINGDIIARVLQEDGVQGIKRSMHMLVENDVNVGNWVAEHIAEELDALDDVVEMVREMDSWL